jgi:glycine/D-amino acid oxidase-like deaminating enzyme
MTQVSLDPATDSLSYWHATAEPLVPAADLPATAPVVVIGGGLLGCWTAYWLAKSGVPVVLLERTAIGWGATGRNGGFLVGGTALDYPSLVSLVGRETARRLHRLTIDGRELAFQVVAEEGIDCDLRRAGTLSLALEGTPPGEIRYGGSLVQEDGFGSEQLDRAQVQELIATLLGERIVGGSFVADDGLLHSSRYLAGIARAAERHGARLVRAEVQSITPRAQGIRLVTSAGQVDAGHVVVALNAWSDTLVPELAELVVPTRGQILAYEPIASVFHTAIGVDVTPTGEYWQQTPDGSIVIGGCRANAPGADVGVREMVATDEVAGRIERVLPELFPALSPLTVARRWAGLMAFTSDRLPIVDTVPGISNVWVVGGFSGHGMVFGPRLGQLLATTVTTGAKPEDLAPLRIDRPTLQPLS